MSSAKENLLIRLNTFKSIIYPETTIDVNLNSKALTETLFNDKVRMLRNGMSIIGFTILEDFIKIKTGEILKNIGSPTSLCTFNNLPPKIKETVTINALKGISSRADMLRRNSGDYILFVQEETNFIASTKNTNFEFSAYSIGWDKSNLNDDDIKQILSIFNVDGGWEAIKQLSILFNCSLIDPKNSFKNFATNRHKSAHNTTTDSAMVDLMNFENQSKIIALCFDCLLSKSLSYIISNDAQFLNLTLKTKPSEIKFRIIKFKDGKWKEYKQENLLKAYRVNINYLVLLNDAKLRSQANKEVLLVKNENDTIKDWFIFL